jgi:hypothetical protein
LIEQPMLVRFGYRLARQHLHDRVAQEVAGDGHGITRR